MNIRIAQVQNFTAKNGNIHAEGNAVFSNLLMHLIFSSSFKSSVKLHSESGITNPDQPENFDYAFNVYPNPTNDHVTIAFIASNEETDNVRLMDVTGRIILSKDYTSVIGENQYLMDLSTVAKGIYLVILQNGSTLLQSKIIVQ